jgi:hypothetical protein
VFPVFPDAPRLKDYCHEEIPYNSIITVVFQFAVNSESMIGEMDCAPSAFAGDLATSESYRRGGNEDQEVRRIQTFREPLASLAIIPEEQRLSLDPYQDLYGHAERRIFELAVNVGWNPGKIGKIFNVWLFAPIQDLLFLQNPTLLSSADFMWRAAH